MKKWITYIGIAVAVIVLLFIIVGLLLPTTYAVSSSVVIDAPQAKVHELVADLEEWPKWEPWTEEDDGIMVSRTEQTTGVGAGQQWTDTSGGGELTITRSDPDYGIDYDLTFNQKYHCKASITHTPTANGVRVTWTMSGDTGTPVIGGFFARLMPALIGPMFDQGMQNLKTAAEAEAESEALRNPAPEGQPDSVQ